MPVPKLKPVGPYSTFQFEDPPEVQPIWAETVSEEIISKSLHPKRINRFMLEYNFDFDEWFD